MTFLYIFLGLFSAIVLVTLLLLVVRGSSKRRNSKTSGHPPFSVKVPSCHVCGRPGNLGEARVSVAFGHLLGPDDYIFNNVVIRYPDGGYCQIDHVVICSKGILVIETKDWHGEVRADCAKDKTWSHFHPDGTLTEDEISPVFQNRNHIQYLKKQLKAEKMDFYSMVIFINDIDLQLENNDNVILLRELSETYQSLPDTIPLALDTKNILVHQLLMLAD